MLAAWRLWLVVSIPATYRHCDNLSQLVACSLMLVACSLYLSKLGAWGYKKGKAITLAAPGHIPSGHFYDAIAARISEGSHWAGPIEDRFHFRILQGLPLQSWITYIPYYPSCQIISFRMILRIILNCACCLVLEAWRFQLDACRLKLVAWGPDQANAGLTQSSCYTS